MGKKLGRVTDQSKLDMESNKNLINEQLQAVGKQIIKKIKGTKLKVQVAVQGDELRISGKKRDDLQKIITFIKNMENIQALQYVNFRE